MSVVIAEHDVTVYQGDVREQLALLPASSVQCVVTSPPYYGLRDYGCDGQLGLEASPAEYVETMRGVYADVRRVLADDGVLWLNLGDSYSTPKRGSDNGWDKSRLTNPAAVQKMQFAALREGRDVAFDRPSKNMLGMPWRVAFALQDDGWTLRNAIIWHKPNAMPESVTDRLSTRYEHLFLFSKATWRGEPSADIADIDAAWLAALIDGEGTITIGRDRRSVKNAAHADVFTVQVSVANTCVPLLEKAGRLMGGALVHQNNVGVNRPGYAVRISSEKAAALIAAIEPWLIDKKVQASLALAMQETQRRAGTPKDNYQTADGRAYKERLFHAIQAANRREDVDTSWVRQRRRGKYATNPYWFDLDAIREDRSAATEARYKYAFKANSNPASSTNHLSDGGMMTALNDAGRNPGDVWTIPTSPFPGAHFACMPPELARRCILAGCPETGTVLDPFAGSGTTLKVARALGRNSIGIELNPDYIDIIRERIGQTPLDFTEALA